VTSKKEVTEVVDPYWNIDVLQALAYRGHEAAQVFLLFVVEHYLRGRAIEDNALRQTCLGNSFCTCRECKDDYEILRVPSGNRSYSGLS